jgi:hypothetical protein
MDDDNDNTLETGVVSGRSVVWPGWKGRGWKQSTVECDYWTASLLDSGLAVHGANAAQNAYRAVWRARWD